jgi:hypothetical protein
MKAVTIGTRITILVPNGRGMNGVEYKESTGKVMIVNDDGTYALNMGGRYGTPGVATPENIVAIGGKRVRVG